ncbi:hypothetical protein LINPERHAP1_LOCUS6534 [Linum perenne]
MLCGGFSSGKVQIIDSVLLSMCQYWMNIFVLPKAVVKNVEKILQSVSLGGPRARKRAKEAPFFGMLHVFVVISGRFSSAQSDLVWQRHVIPSHCVINWLIFCDKLTTKDKLISLGIYVDPSCVLCSVGSDTRDHVLCDRAYINHVLQLYHIDETPMRNFWEDKMTLALEY